MTSILNAVKKRLCSVLDSCIINMTCSPKLLRVQLDLIPTQNYGFKPETFMIISELCLTQLQPVVALVYGEKVVRMI